MTYDYDGILRGGGIKIVKFYINRYVVDPNRDG